MGAVQYPSWLVYVLLLCIVYVVMQQVRWLLEYAYWMGLQWRQRLALPSPSTASPRGGKTRRKAARSRSPRQRRRPAYDDDDEDDENDYGPRYYQ